MIVFDFDGVLTTNEVIVHEDGTESVICNRSDGLGISLLNKMNIPMLIISSEKNPVVSKRADKLGVPVIQGIENKKEALLEFLNNKDIDLQNTVYVGNDLNDLDCIELVGLSVAPSDAHPRIKSVVNIVLLLPGGRGAVNELATYIVQRIRGRAGQ